LNESIGLKTKLEQTLEQSELKTQPDPKPAFARERLGSVYGALLLFMVEDFARPQDWIPGLQTVPIGKITGLIGVLALLYSFRGVRWRRPTEVVLLALLTLQLWITVPFANVWRGGAFHVTLQFSKVLALVVVAYAVVRSMERLRWLIFVQTVSVAGIAFASVMIGRQADGRLQGAIPGLYGNSNDLALIVVLSIPLCMAFLLITKNPLRKAAWGLALLFMVYCVFLTASRGGAVALLIAALVCLWQFGVKQGRSYLLLLLPLAAAMIWLYAGRNLQDRFEQTNLDQNTAGQITEAAGSSLQRKALLMKSLEVTAAHPLVGVGPGNFEVVSGVWRVTHNSYTQMSAEGGIPALILYLLILWCGIANLRQIRKYRKNGKVMQTFSIALEASLAAYIVGSFAISVAYHLFPYCLVAYTGMLSFVAQQQAEIEKAAPVPVADLSTPAAEWPDAVTTSDPGNPVWQDTWKSV
jgi:O-antigen ligase/polysaccharide polymerase Wzy-like membrane protein